MSLESREGLLRDRADWSWALWHVPGDSVRPAVERDGEHGGSQLGWDRETKCLILQPSALIHSFHKHLPCVRLSVGTGDIMVNKMQPLLSKRPPPFRDGQEAVTIQLAKSG